MLGQPDALREDVLTNPAEGALVEQRRRLDWRGQHELHLLECHATDERRKRDNTVDDRIDPAGTEDDLLDLL